MKSYSFSFSQRVKLLRYLFDLSARAQLRENFYQVREQSGYFSNNNLTDILEKAVDFLDEDSRRIIVNDFKLKAEKHWWQSFYSRSTYYRLKSKATAELINCLHG